MLRIGICEDNKDFSEDLKSKIEQKLFKNDIDYEIDCFYSGEDIINHIMGSKTAYDIIFFDIDLPNLNGIDTARRIRNLHEQTVFIFISYLDDRVFDALNLNIFQFVRKNYFEKEIDTVLDSLIEKLDNLVTKYRFPVYDEIIYLKLSEIVYLRVDDRCVIIHTKNDSYKTDYRTLTKVPIDFKNKGFFEIYKGIMVNLSHVKSLDGYQITLSNNDIHQIARRRINDFKETFYKHIADSS